MFGIIRRALAMQARPNAVEEQPTAARPGPGARVATIATAAPEERPAGLIAKLLSDATPEAPTAPTAADDPGKVLNKRRAGPIRSLLGFGDQINS